MKNVMEKRKLRVIFNKSGSGSTTTKLALPKTWVDKLGVKEWDKIVDVSFDGEKIVIEKTNESENTLVGKKWSEISKKEQDVLLENANAVIHTGEDLYGDGECIFDLTEKYSILGKVVDGEKIIDDDAVIYNSQG